MGKEVVLFSSEEKQNLQTVSNFLHQLADKVAGGQVILRQGDEELVLTLPQNVVLEIKAEEEAKKTKIQRSLEIEIEWIVGDQGSTGVTLG
jgi:amphi-Trp domain-containing protein